jgi:cyclase
MYRLIPALLIKDGALVKTRSFRPYKYLGDPVNIARIFLEKGADELLINDSSAFRNGINEELLEEISSNCFVPITYAGNIRSTADARKVVNAGIERVAIGIYRPSDWQLLNDVTAMLGRSGVCSILNITFMKSFRRSFIYDYREGRARFRYRMDQVLKDANVSRPGEIILVDVSREGTRQGFSLGHLRQRIQPAIPVTAYGGVANYQECKQLWEDGFTGVGVSSLVSLRPPHDAVLISYPQEHVAKLTEGMTACTISIDRYDKM